MEQFDLEKLNKAIIYADRIANGKNPINNLPVDEDYVLNDPNVIRCMFFIRDVLGAVKENKGFVGGRAFQRKEPKNAFPIGKVQNYSGREIMTITPFVNLLNEGVDKETTELVKVKRVTDWLKAQGYLQVEHSQKLNKDVTTSTEKGNAAGITSTLQVSPNGTEYYRVEYKPEAQEMIVKNLSEILESK